MNITREQFMEFFRDTESLNTLTPDDRVEVFQTILLGSSDITYELIQGLLIDYQVEHLAIIEIC